MKKVYIFGLMMLLLVSVVIAKPPHTQSLDGSLTIETLQYSTHPINTEYYLHGHVHTTSDGMMKNASENQLLCSYHLYSEKDNWEHLSTGVLSPYGIGMSVRINESYFNETGDYAVMLWCECDGCDIQNPSDKIGGFVRYFFTVVDSTDSFSTLTDFQTNIFIVIALASLLALALLISSGFIGIIASMGMTIYSLSLFNVNMWLGIISLCSGLLLMLYFATKQAS